ncbi:MAG: TVP38/TMEM64 family protein [Gammaproteobacteria bacterium]
MQHKGEGRVDDDRQRPKGGAIRMLVAAALAVAVTGALILRGHVDGASLRHWLDNAGGWGPLAFMASYAAATLVFFPGSVLTLAGGALFGPVWGTVYSLTGATIGATGAFLIARYLAADWVARRSGGRLRRLIDGVEAEGWRFVAFVRLVPLVPFNLLNFALGLTRIRLLHYVVASYVAMLPGAMAYTYLGYAGREALAGGQGLIQKGLLALALLAAVAFLPRFILRMRRNAQQP